MSVNVRRIGMAALAVVAVVTAVWCWTQGVRQFEFAPYADGAPPFTATHYSGPWIGGAAAAVIVAGLAALDVWRLRLRRRADLP
ncbi:hypothetical protein ACFYVR_22485 [Rhodococcus sp. NPDC003318]|uniref:hypothetical protein n=1 Tax=Rhodococcus sp. NPDC003318 TaxID=3364503 RepID=UPI0036A6E97F